VLLSTRMLVVPRPVAPLPASRSMPMSSALRLLSSPPTSSCVRPRDCRRQGSQQGIDTGWASQDDWPSRSYGSELMETARAALNQVNLAVSFPIQSTDWEAHTICVEIDSDVCTTVVGGGIVVPVLPEPPPRPMSLASPLSARMSVPRSLASPSPIRWRHPRPRRRQRGRMRRCRLR
jgi:hypothetical protein